MVALGQWPYEHTISLEKMHRDSNVHMVYFVDDDIIIPASKVESLVAAGNVYDEKMYTVMSEDLARNVDAHRDQNFAPDVPAKLEQKRHEDRNEEFAAMDEKVMRSGPVLIVSGQSTEVMKDLGATWNPHLGFWLLSATHLKTLREKKREDYGGKLFYESHLDNMVKVWGDDTPHVDLLRKVSISYDEKTRIWLVRLSQFDQIAHLVSRK